MRRVKQRAFNKSLRCAFFFLKVSARFWREEEEKLSPGARSRRRSKLTLCTPRVCISRIRTTYFCFYYVSYLYHFIRLCVSGPLMKVYYIFSFSFVCSFK